MIDKLPFRPKKKLGQNFIFSKPLLKKIARVCFPSPEASHEEIIIEVGTGYGTLTYELLEETNCRRVISLEKDKYIFSWLKTNFHNEKKKVVFLNWDVLEVNWKLFFSRKRKNKKKKYIVVGNLPYYLSGILLSRLLFFFDLFHSFVFLVQKEVAQGWASKKGNKNYSSLTILINFLAEIKIMFSVDKNAFFPVPPVDGTLVRIMLKENINLTRMQVKRFYFFLRLCFSSPRKTLVNNLIKSGKIKDKIEVEEWFLKFNIPRPVRAAELSEKEYWSLYNFFEESKNK